MDDVDWRIKVTGTVAEDTRLKWNGQVVEAGARVKLVSIVDLPKKRTLTIPVPELTALYISTAHSNWRSFRDVKRANKIDSSNKKEVSFESDEAAFDAVQHLATSVICAFTALESFANDAIPLEHEYWHTKSSTVILEKSDKKEFERRMSLGFKLNEVLPAIFDVAPPKGKSPVWSSYKKLKKCRDSLIHAKSHETRSVDSGAKNLWDELFNVGQPTVLAKDVFNYFLKSRKDQPLWFKKYPQGAV
jgi:hypothetical protein